MSLFEYTVTGMSRSWHDFGKGDNQTSMETNFSNAFKINIVYWHTKKGTFSFVKIDNHSSFTGTVFKILSLQNPVDARTAWKAVLSLLYESSVSVYVP